MRIAQITDTHIAVPPLAAREADLERHIDAILALDPRPDLVVHTGDAANSGSAEEYAVLRRLMARLPMPWVIVPGNRDSRARMRAAFAGLPWIEKQDDVQGDAQAPLIFTVRLGPLLLIGMDSKGPRTNKGWMDKERLARLDSLLAQAGGAPVVIAMHHPPFVIAEMRDSRQFADWEHVRALEACLLRHPNVELIITGHTHRFARGQIAKQPAFTMPAAAHDLRKGSARALGEAPAILVHDFTADGRWQETRLIQGKTDSAPAPLPAASDC